MFFIWIFSLSLTISQITAQDEEILLLNRLTHTLTEQSAKYGVLLAGKLKSSEVKEDKINTFLEDASNVISKESDPDLTKLAWKTLGDKKDIQPVLQLLRKILRTYTKELIVTKAESLVPGFKFSGKINFSNKEQENLILGSIAESVSGLANKNMTKVQQKAKLEEVVNEIDKKTHALIKSSTNSGGGSSISARSGGFSFTNNQEQNQASRKLLKRITTKIVSTFSGAGPFTSYVSVGNGEGDVGSSADSSNFGHSNFNNQNTQNNMYNSLSGGHLFGSGSQNNHQANLQSNYQTMSQNHLQSGFQSGFQNHQSSSQHNIQKGQHHGISSGYQQPGSQVFQSNSQNGFQSGSLNDQKYASQTGSLNSVLANSQSGFQRGNQFNSNTRNEFANSQSGFQTNSQRGSQFNSNTGSSSVNWMGLNNNGGYSSGSNFQAQNGNSGKSYAQGHNNIASSFSGIANLWSFNKSSNSADSFSGSSGDQTGSSFGRLSGSRGSSWGGTKGSSYNGNSASSYGQSGLSSSQYGNNLGSSSGALFGSKGGSSLGSHFGNAYDGVKHSPGGQYYESSGSSSSNSFSNAGNSENKYFKNSGMSW